MADYIICMETAVLRIMKTCHIVNHFLLNFSRCFQTEIITVFMVVFTAFNYFITHNENFSLKRGLLVALFTSVWHPDFSSSSGTMASLTKAFTLLPKLELRFLA